MPPNNEGNDMTTETKRVDEQGREIRTIGKARPGDGESVYSIDSQTGRVAVNVGGPGGAEMLCDDANVPPAVRHALEMTLAHKVSERMNGDGRTFETQDGATLEEACVEAGASRIYQDLAKRQTSDEMLAYVFGDNSAIVVAHRTAWDVRPFGCIAFCWDGVGCECAEDNDS